MTNVTEHNVVARGSAAVSTINHNSRIGKSRTLSSRNRQQHRCGDASTVCISVSVRINQTVFLIDISRVVIRSHSRLNKTKYSTYFGRYRMKQTNKRGKLQNRPKKLILIITVSVRMKRERTRDIFWRPRTTSSVYQLIKMDSEIKRERDRQCIR